MTDDLSLHVDLIAEVLAEPTDLPLKDYEEVMADLRTGELAERFANRLADTNPRFDRVRFLEACGV